MADGTSDQRPRLRITWVAEYQADPAHYPGCDADPVKMAAYDQASLDEGLLDAVELMMNDTVSVTVEAAMPTR